MTQVHGKIDPARAPDVNLPVIPDKVVDKIQSGQDVALEEISEAAAGMKATREASRGAPLHAGQLAPISRGQAAEMSRFGGEHLPSFPTPRRVIPRPFQRPSINVRVPGEPQPEWRTVAAEQVPEGHVVPGVGTVMEKITQTRYSGAAEQVPIVRRQQLRDSFPEVGDLLVQEYTGEAQERLLKAYGSEQVAVGLEVVLTGPEQCQLVVPEGAPVQAFGIWADSADSQAPQS